MAKPMLYVNKHILARCLRISERKAIDLMKKINDDLRNEGYLVFQKSVPSQEVIKRTKVNAEAILECIREYDEEQKKNCTEQS